jgi:NADH-quinone oxidoreductase subunit G
MPNENITIIVDDKEYQVPPGMNLVDAAKFYADNDIPVFCYHPKMEPVGMCRMCLVEMGTLARDRTTGELQLDDKGKPQVRWMPKLQTACTTTCTPDLVIRTNTAKVQEARDDVIEFILTSHPLDCPICDKGGECPLQNLTMRHGAGVSRFNFDDKMHLEKHYPLGELIFLDRERCIQCARCVRFSDEMAGDPVLGFHERGRALQIVTISDPPFDSYFSGNTTDICPVGALTTADFRFGARPWELNEVPSLDPYGPEGANVSLSTRLDRDSGGITIIKRVMPRQNEQVNEIWISDKTRFGHHHSRAPHRLTSPMIRRNGELVEASWAEADQAIIDALEKAQGKVGAVAGAMLSNEDLWELRRLVEQAGGKHLGIFPATMTGADIVSQVGVTKGTNLRDLGSDTAILVIASDLEEEAPIWWLRVKRAGDHGAKIIVANGRKTKLDRYATCVLRFDYGETVLAMNNLVGSAMKLAGAVDQAFVDSRVEGFKELRATKFGRIPSAYEEAAKIIAGAKNLIIFVGNEGVTLSQHGDLMQSAANLLAVLGRAGKPDSGLIPVWTGANIQGAFDMGYRAEDTADALSQSVVFVAGADPIGTDPQARSLLGKAGFRVVTSLFATATTDMADVVLPRQSVPERDGTFTSGERRVQRFYTAQGFIGDTRPDWKIFSEIRHKLNPAVRVKLSAGAVMAEITKAVGRYAEMSYKNLAHTERQFPDVGGEDLYYGGTAYNNTGGLGVQWSVDAEDPAKKITVRPVEAAKAEREGLLAVPVRVLYDRTPEFFASEMMRQRIPQPYAELNAADAGRLKVNHGDTITLVFGKQKVRLTAQVNGSAPEGVILVPLNLSAEPVPLAPLLVKVEK